jgi:hypothetical protein
MQTAEVSAYAAPCYKYPCRTSRYYIFSINLPSLDHRAEHWVLRGAALLCNTDA